MNAYYQAGDDYGIRLDEALDLNKEKRVHLSSLNQEN
jgi:hypothetical protein